MFSEEIRKIAKKVDGAEIKDFGNKFKNINKNKYKQDVIDAINSNFKKVFNKAGEPLDFDELKDSDKNAKYFGKMIFEFDDQGLPRLVTENLFFYLLSDKDIKAAQFGKDVDSEAVIPVSGGKGIVIVYL